MGLDRSFRLVGRAWTLRYGTVGEDPGSVGDYIDDLGPGQVVVLDNQGRRDATVWGDLLTTVAAGRRVAGTVIDGVCRDVDRSIELGYPIFSRGNWMRTGKDRVRVEEIGGPCRSAASASSPATWCSATATDRRRSRPRARRRSSPRPSRSRTPNARSETRSPPEPACATRGRRSVITSCSAGALPRDAGARGTAAVTRSVNQIANRHEGKNE